MPSPTTKRFRNATGLTLVEMLVVAGILAVLAGLLLPIMAQARVNSRRATCINNLKSIGQAYTTAVTASGGALPDSYFKFSDAGGLFSVLRREAAVDQPDKLFDYMPSDILRCPADEGPVDVLGRDVEGKAGVIQTSYAYNVSLPLLFRNMSRLGNSVETVVFYDGNAAGVEGLWNNASRWADPTIQSRHRRSANYLFADGHVDSKVESTAVAFESGAKWIAFGPGKINFPAGVAPAEEEEEDEDPEIPSFPPVAILGELKISSGTDLVVDGPIFSGASIALGNGCTVQNISSGGTISMGSSPVISGNLLSKGAASFGSGGTVTGDVNIHGPLVISNVIGNITASGTVSLDIAQGNIYATGDVNVANKVTGNVFSGGNVTVASLAGGQVHAAGNAHVDDITGSLFCGGKATVDGVASGAVNSGGDATIYKAAQMVAAGGNVTITNNALAGISAGGNVDLQTTVTCDVICSGALGIKKSERLNGNALAGGNVTLNASSRITGNLGSNGNVTLGKSAKVTGHVDYLGTLTIGSGGASVGSSTHLTAPLTITPTAPTAPNTAIPAPASYSPILMPEATDFETGDEDVALSNGEELALAPGKYGSLTVGTNCDLTFSSGCYYFTSATIANGLGLTLNCDDGPVQIYVEGNVDMGTTTSLTINGGTAKDIYMETHGNFSCVNGGRWNGIIFAPGGNINFGSNTEISGACFAAGAVSFGNGSHITYIAPN